MVKTKPGILFVTETQIWPAYGGEKINAYHTLDALSRQFGVTVFAPTPGRGCPLQKQVKDWHEMREPPKLFRERLFESRFVLAQNACWRKEIEEILASAKPEIVWFNSGHWGHYADLARQYGARTIMQTLNAQSQLQRQGLSSRPITRWHLFYALRFLLESLHERMLFSRFDRVLSVCEKDRLFHARFAQPECSLYLPNFINEAWYRQSQPSAREETLVVMTANFGAFQNRVGAIWLAQKVWPLVRQEVPAAQLELIGVASRGWAQEIEQYPGVRYRGTVESVVPDLHRATAGVIPLLHGSGTRLKALEALACALPLVSTSLGLDGLAVTPEEHALIGDTPEDFARQVVKLLKHPQKRQSLGRNGVALVRQEYSFEINMKRISTIVEAAL